MKLGRTWVYILARLTERNSGAAYLLLSTILEPHSYYTPPGNFHGMNAAIKENR